MRRAIVCGGRDYQGNEDAAEWLVVALTDDGIDEVIHGDARGADRWAAGVAREAGFDILPIPAETRICSRFSPLSSWLSRVAEARRTWSTLPMQPTCPSRSTPIKKAGPRRQPTSPACPVERTHARPLKAG